MDHSKLKEKLELHTKWLNSKVGGVRLNLSNANLSGANLSNANLSDTNLRSANLRSVAGLGQFKRCPTEGQFIGYKKSREGLIIKLGIPKTAKRVNALSSMKCRADKAKVLGIYNMDGSLSAVTTATSLYVENFKYTVGSIVKVDNFNDNDRLECEAGIHFFMTFNEANEY